MSRTPDRRVGPMVDEDDLLANEPVYPTTDYTITRTGGVVTREEWVRNPGNLLKSVDYTRTAGVVTQEVRKIYAEDGTTVNAQLTVDYVRTGGLVTSEVRTRNV